MVVFGIIAAFAVFCLVVNWWTHGLVSGTEAAILIAVFGGLAVGVFAADGVWARAGALAVLVVLCFWMVQKHLKDTAKRYYLDKIRVYEAAIQADPRNFAARSALASAYYAIGDLDTAISALEIALSISPKLIKEQKLLLQWQRERSLRDNPTIVCKVCRTQNVWGETLCYTCRQPIAYPDRAAWINRISVCIRNRYVLMSLLVMLISAAALFLLPVYQAAAFIMCCLLAAIGWIILISSGEN